ncbi:hypothetical protein GCM10009837_23260 [Streptomyces durmitorensis]|uniref:Uncharacterized protein n=1 Tax=Streptomyces durmitorensis TaxID=319947 RepID=A0ABY4PMU5_9ACTN|nr:hypothetical protein [Streptomyces durmitorensis]UQT55051.1 hypothetical protein M4V62_08050 [Streptomyces durmitorensis]
MSEGARFCGRCDQPIAQGQPAVTFLKVSISAGGATITWHETCAKRAGYVRRTQS